MMFRFKSIKYDIRVLNGLEVQTLTDDLKEILDYHNDDLADKKQI